LCERRRLDKGYLLRAKGKPDPTPARRRSERPRGSTRHALTGVYLKSTDNRPDDHCWWCDPKNDSGTHQTRDHLFKLERPTGRDVGEGQGGDEEGQAEVDLLADERCSPAALDFLKSTHVRRAAPPVEEFWDSEDEAEVAEVEEQAE